MTQPQILGTIATMQPGTYTIGATFTPAPVAVKKTTLVGTDALPVNLTRTPKSRYVRIYCPLTHGLNISLTGIPAQVIPHISFKDDVTAQLLNTFFGIVNRPIRLTWRHEPEGDLTTAAYQAGWILLRQLCDKAPNAKLITLTEVYTSYAQEHGKTGPDGLDTLAEHMSPLMPDGSRAADEVFVDVYQDHKATTYPTYAALTARAYQIAKNLGLPLGFAEWGRQPIPDDTAGHGAGLAYADDIAQADVDGIVAMGLWDNGGCSLTPGHQLPYVNAAIAALSA